MLDEASLGFGLAASFRYPAFPVFTVSSLILFVHLTRRFFWGWSGDSADAEPEWGRGDASGAE